MPRPDPVADFEAWLDWVLGGPDVSPRARRLEVG
jgi:hypothetical protein